MPRRTLKDLDALLGPERVAQAETRAEQRMQRMLVKQVRKELGLTQAKVAKAMGISQSALSQLESQDDMQLSTLRRLVNAMGGRMEVVLRFGGRPIVVAEPRRRSA
jgi:DNA-binding XRE family transcriptional regulator